MFIIKKTEYKTKKEINEIQLNEISEGVNSFDKFIIFKQKDIINVYDRKCDHAGGRILSRKDNHVCPYHNWKFFPEKGRYNNGAKKKKLNFKIFNKKILIENKIFVPHLKKIRSNNKVKIEYINHAFLIIKGNGFKFATDPWALGPAFGLGWWLKNKTKKNWIFELNECDFIYISHNHPDHLHQLSLSKIEKNKQFIVPKFQSNSVKKFVTSMNFQNIKEMNFLETFNFNETELNLMILKSGDFRDDSGLYFTAGNTSFILNVDSNNLNSHNLPKIDVYAASYAGGASGFPLVFENYSEKEKQKILQNYKKIFKSIRLKEISLTNAKYFLPYAGSFEEKLKRNLYIRKYNQKNLIDDYKDINNNFITLDINKKNEFIFLNSKLIKQSKINNSKFKDLKETEYERKFQELYSVIKKKEIENYFLKSKFKDDLILFLNLTTNVGGKVNCSLIVDFSKNKIEIKFLKKKISKLFLKNEQNRNKLRCLMLTVRMESFINVIKNMDSWENLVIGFECNIYRIPNIYNVKFWHYFSNIYVKNKFKKNKIQCYSCERLNQSLFDRILNI